MQALATSKAMNLASRKAISNCDEVVHVGGPIVIWVLKRTRSPIGGSPVAASCLIDLFKIGLPCLKLFDRSAASDKCRL
jgi:hypothetical protein